MVADGKTLALYAVLAAIVSLGLLVFAWASSDAGVTNVVIGAITGYWLREATFIGRAVTTGATTLPPPEPPTVPPTVPPVLPPA